MKVIVLDYGEVYVNETELKTVEIFNESCKQQIYEVQRDAITNPLDHVFHFRTYTWKLLPGQKHVCEIRYRPFVAFSQNCDYFHIVDTSDDCLKIVTRGFCVGPEVSSSVTKLFFSIDENCEGKKRIKLTNTSKVRATFIFDIDQKNGPFKLDLTHGFVNACSHKYVMISFVPRKTGKYACYLPCLILHQDPIIFELYGSCVLKVWRKDDVDVVRFPRRVRNGFEGYMNNCIDTTTDLPLFSLSRDHLDFGQADIESENIPQRIPQVVCLTNHSQSILSVRWEKDEIFSVTPRTTQIRSRQSALFEVFFNPDAERILFSREIKAYIFTENKYQVEESLEFPFVTSIRAVGHSFPISSSGWIPQYEIPETVIMPPCVPPFPVYTTFLIKKFGHLPLMFHFVPPASSRFYVKPMLGLIHEDYQIIVVGMVPKPESEQIYMERWVIYLNGNMKNEISIDFKGYAEYPNLNFKDNNFIRFSPVYPRCQQMERIAMRNITRHTIRYEFCDLSPELNVEMQEGVIHSNDVLTQTWTFCPDEPLDYDFTVKCTVIALKNVRPIGHKNCLTLRVAGRSETGSLVAIPEQLHFGDQEYNTSKALSFHVFNMSTVNIYYQMVCRHFNWPIGNLEKDVEIRPFSETVFPGAHERITVTINPRTIGYYEFFIQYFVRVNSQTNVLIPNENPSTICQVKCTCVLPTLKVNNLCSYGCYSQMSKPFIWKIMQIDTLNAVLKNLLPEENKTLHIRYEPMRLNMDAVFINLIIINPTTMKVSWVLKRIYRCSCKPVTKQRGISLQYTEFHCIHDDVCSIRPNFGTLKPKEETVITIELRYTILGESEIIWDLDIGHDRHVFLHMIIEVLSNSSAKLHFPNGTELNFNKIYLGYRSVYQTHWISNVTDYNLPFIVDLKTLCKINESHYSEVFSCLTPRGIVEARSIQPIIIKFQPKFSGNYKVMLPVKLGNQETELILKGETTYDYKSKLTNEVVPARCNCKHENLPVYFSVYCIDLPHMEIHSRVTKMFLVHNSFMHDPLSYEWESPEIPEILSIQIHPRKGIIQPNATRSFRLIIDSKGSPYKIDLNISCQLLNATKRREYQRSLLKYHLLCDELKGQFVITEKGFHVPEPWIEKLEEPTIFYKAITVRCCIHSPEDKNLIMTLDDELKCSPTRAICTDINEKKRVRIEEKELSTSLFILEGLLWDIISCRTLTNTIQKTLISDTNLNYTEFISNLSDRKRSVKRSYISPPRMLTDSILQKMLFVIVHEEFALDTTHLIPNEDIRHANYIKLSRKNTISGQHNGKIELPLWQRSDGKFVSIVDTEEIRDQSKTFGRELRSGSVVTFRD